MITSPAVNISVTGSTLTGIAVAPKTMTVAQGGTTIITATGTFADSTTGNVSGSATWVSGDSTVATVNDSGIARAMGKGSSTISATLTAVTDTATLTVP